MEKLTNFVGFLVIFSSTLFNPWIIKYHFVSGKSYWQLCKDLMYIFLGLSLIIMCALPSVSDFYSASTSTTTAVALTTSPLYVDRPVAPKGLTYNNVIRRPPPFTKTPVIFFNPQIIGCTAVDLCKLLLLYTCVL